MAVVQVKVPGSTTNLGPGFDVLGMALNIYNTFEMEKSAKLEIEVYGEGTETLSRDESNLVYKSAKVFYDYIGEKCPSLKIRIINNIPLARGLGSSGTAIIGGLMGANALCDNPLPLQQIINLAAKMDGHPDNVSASILGGVVIASSTDNGVAYMKLIPPKPINVVAVVPEFQLLTSDARRILPQTLDLPTAVFNIGRCSLLVGALFSGNYELLRISMDDKLHQPYRATLIPGTQDVFDAARSVDETVAVAISGAGSTIVAFCSEHNCFAVGKKMFEAFLKNNIKSIVMVLDIDTEGSIVTYV
jgi:homoserine kinase